MKILVIFMTTSPKVPVILGLDPGFARLGYAVVSGPRQLPVIQTVGCFETSAREVRAQRFLALAHFLKKIIKDFKPTQVALETLFFSTNVKTALGVAEARGVITYIVTEAGLPMSEFSPQQVKITATGDGRADKLQVQKMLKLMFKLKQVPHPDDAADALAIALTGLLQINPLV